MPPGRPQPTEVAPYDDAVDDATRSVPVGESVPTDTALLATADPVSGNGRRERDRQHGLWLVLRTTPLPALVVGILLAVGFAVLGWNLNSTGPTLYTSRTVMAIDQPYGIATAGDEGILLKLEILRLKYQGLAGTDAMAGPAAKKLGVPVNTVLAGTSVALPNDSLLLVVTGTWTSPGEAEQLSSAMATEITTYVKTENTDYSVPAADQFFIDAVDPTTPATASTSSHSKSAADAAGLALLGLILGFALTQLLLNRKLLAA